MLFTLDQLYQISQEAVTIFASKGLASCLCGGTGCALYGMCHRRPNDVDLVVLTHAYDTETLKAMLVQHSSNFYPLPSRKIGATYKLLYYRIGIGGCKVDILTPGIMNIPDIPSARVSHINGLPVMPSMPLLMLKIQAWDDHRTSDRMDYRRKGYVDERDIKELLMVAARRGEHKTDASWLPHSGRESCQTIHPNNDAQRPHS